MTNQFSFKSSGESLPCLSYSARSSTNRISQGVEVGTNWALGVWLKPGLGIGRDGGLTGSAYRDMGGIGQLNCRVSPVSIPGASWKSVGFLPSERLSSERTPVGGVAPGRCGGVAWM